MLVVITIGLILMAWIFLWKVQSQRVVELKIHRVIAGDVTIERTDNQLESESWNKPILSLDGDEFEVAELFAGRAVGNSMKPVGIPNGSLFFAEFVPSSALNKSDIVVLKTPDGINEGRFKLRQFTKKGQDGFINTRTFDANGVEKVSTPHPAECVEARVVYVV